MISVGHDENYLYFEAYTSEEKAILYLFATHVLAVKPNGCISGSCSLFKMPLEEVLGSPKAKEVINDLLTA